MSRARLIPILVLALFLGGMTAALAQEATPPAEEAACEAEPCADPAEEPVTDETVAEDPAEEPESEPTEEEVTEVDAEPTEEEAVDPVDADLVAETENAQKGVEASAAALRASSAIALATVTVEVVDFDYRAREVTIAPGDTVTWNFTGEQPHTVTADDNAFDSGQLTSGDFSMRFDEVGTYRYYCTLHGGPGGDGMSGIVVVEGGSSEGPPSADNGEEGTPGGEETGNGALPRTGGSVPSFWVFAVAILFTGIVLWRVARLAETN